MPRPKIHIEADTRNRQVLINSQNLPRDANQGVVNAFHFIGQSLVRTAKRGIFDKSAKTGRVYLIRRGKRHQASAPGEYPANITGTLAKSISYDKANTGHTLEFGGGDKRITEKAGYAKFLEQGTSRMKPRPFLTKAINKEKGNIHKFLYENITRAIKKNSDK